jgi:hypothetical protein
LIFDQAGLSLNADARWGQDSAIVQRCDEECAAYVMVEVQQRSPSGPNKGELVVVPGYEREKCLLTDVDSLALPLRWRGDAARTSLLPGAEVSLRILFRDATIFSLSIAA